MSVSRRLVLGVAIWMAGITALHMGLNMNWSIILNDRMPPALRRLYVAYIPVT